MRARLKLERSPCLLLSCVGALTYLGVARAQTGGSAAELFDRGVADMLAGKPETGCPALDESYRLDPKPGALFAAARCQAEWGKSFTALQRYEAYLALLAGLPPEQQTRHAERRDLARTAVEQLRPSVPQLQLVVPDPAPAGFSVSLDGTALTPASLAQPVLLDPGEHTLETRAEGGSVSREVLTLQAGESRRVVLQLGSPAPAPPPVVSPTPASVAVPVSAAAPASGESQERPAESGSSWSSSLGWVLGGVGVAGVVVGSVAGLAALHQGNIAEEECAELPDNTGKKPCSARGYEAVDRGNDLATVANISFGVGVGGLVAGAVLLLTAEPPAKEKQVAEWRPVVEYEPGGAWLGVSGAW